MNYIRKVIEFFRDKNKKVLKQRKYVIESEFFGLFSGDYECGCIDVDRQTFKKILGKTPDRFDKSYFNARTFRVYLTDIMRMAPIDYQKQCIIKVKIELEPLENKITI